MLPVVPPTGIIMDISHAPHFTTTERWLICWPWNKIHHLITLKKDCLPKMPFIIVFFAPPLIYPADFYKRTVWIVDYLCQSEGSVNRQAFLVPETCLSKQKKGYFISIISRIHFFSQAIDIPYTDWQESQWERDKWKYFQSLMNNFWISNFPCWTDSRGH